MLKQRIRYAAVPILLLGLIASAVCAQNTVQTIAGGGPNNLPALKASMGTPNSVVVDGAGDVYIADGLGLFKLNTTGNVTIAAANGGQSGLAVDSVSDIFFVSGCTIQEISAQTGNISTVAGSDQCSYSGDGGPATSATLNQPSGVALDRSGNIFIADTWNCLVREVSAATGVISTLAGTPPDINGSLHCGYTGDGGLATSTELTFPADVAVDGSENVLIADTGSCEIRKVTIATGIITDLAGIPVTPSGCSGYSGDGGPATSASLAHPNAVTVDISGNILIADTGNDVIRKVAAATGIITTVAGNGSPGYSGDGAPATSAQINGPFGVAVDSSGDIFIADRDNSVIREVSASTGNISTFAGVAVPDPYQLGQMIGFPAYCGDGYPATDAELGSVYASPWSAGLATDSSGNVFIADTANNVIREVSASTGIITTVAGNGFAGFSGDGSSATSAELYNPRDVAVDGSGNIFIVDSINCVIRKVSSTTGIISTVAGTPPDSSGVYCGYSGDGGPATAAELDFWPLPVLVPEGGVAVDSSGNIFIADTENDVIREVYASTGIINTIAGNPSSPFAGTGDGGPATNATFNFPYGVAVDGAGNVFIADTFDYAIREVMAVNGNIYTVAGDMSLGAGFSGDGGPADLAQFGFVFRLFLDPAGNLFIPDPDNCVIREVSATTGIISTVAGTPHSCGYWGDGGPALRAGFDNPGVVAADTSGDLVVLDSIRVRTVAGLVQGPAAGAALFPSPLAFSNVFLGTSSTLTVMLSNRGSLPNSVTSVAISGANASDFSETNSCAGHSLTGGGGSCAINVTFTPSIAAVESAVLTVTDAVGTQTVDLNGTGANPPEFSPSPASLAFGNQQESILSSPINVTVTNNGKAALIFSTVTVSGANAGDFAIATDTCSPGTVAVNSSCYVSMAFRPSTTGPETASLQFTDNAPGSPHSIGLTGTGTDFSVGLASGGSATATVAPGSSATYNLQVRPISGFNGPVSLSCTGAPAESACVLSQLLATPNGTAAVPFTVQVTTVAPSVLPPRAGPQSDPLDGLRLLLLVVLVGLAAMPLAFAFRFRRAAAPRRRACAWALAAGILLLASAFLTSCGGGADGSGKEQNNPGTATGNYTLTITGTSNGVSHSQNLAFIVN